MLKNNLNEIKLPVLEFAAIALSAPNITYHDGYFGADFDVNIQSAVLKKICGNEICKDWKFHDH